jgi:hypothetical protein
MSPVRAKGSRSHRSRGQARRNHETPQQITYLYVSACLPVSKPFIAPSAATIRRGSLQCHHIATPATVVSLFEGTITQIVALAAFLPILRILPGPSLPEARNVC